MSSEVQVAIIAGAFAVLGTVIGAGLTFLFSLLEKRREDRRRAEEAAERESAVFHGAFALSNYIASRLNDWDEFRSVHVLQRLQVAQPYLAKLIDRSPPESERLMVSLIDVGLQLEGLLSLVGFLLGLEDEEAITESSEIDQCVQELAGAVELVQITLDAALPFMTDAEVAEIAGVDVEEFRRMTEGSEDR